MIYQKKPVRIEARRFTVNGQQDLAKWCSASLSSEASPHERTLSICTLEGVMTARIGDWVIQGVEGEFYPCRGDIFEKTYEQVIE